MLKVCKLGKIYTEQGSITIGIQHVSATFDVGEFVVITGKSGSGKSTFLNILAGTESYSSGQILFDDEDVEYFGNDDWQRYRKEKVAVIHQDFQLIESISVRKNIEVAFALNHSVAHTNKINHAAINSILRRTGLTAHAKQSVATLSGGQKQRVAIARALAKDTLIILADEPTGNLDKVASAEIANLLGEISKDKLLVVVSHDTEQFENYATRQITMDNGTIQSDIVSKKNNMPISEKNASRIVDKQDKFEFFEVKALINSLFFSDKKAGIYFVIAVFVVMLITMFLASVVLQFSTPYYEGVMNTPIFGSVERDRLILKNDDSTAFTESQINTLKADPSLTYIVENDIFLDVMFEIEFNNSHGIVRNQYYANSIESPKVKNTALSWGRIPDSDDEILLSSDNGEAIDENQRETLITSVDQSQKSKKVKIVGGFVDNSKYLQTIYFTKNAALQISDEFLDTYSEFELTIKQTDKQTQGKYTVLLNNDVKRGIAYLTLKLAQELLISLDDEYSQEIIIETKNLYYTKGAEWSDVKVIPVDALFLGHNISPDDPIILLNPLDYLQIVSDDVYQISIYMKDSSDYANVISKMEALGFLVYYPYAINLIGADARTIVIQTLIFIIASLIGGVLLALSLLTLRKQSLGIFRSNAIIRSLGYRSKSIIIADAIRNIFRVLISSAINVALVFVMVTIKNNNLEKYKNTFIPLTNLSNWFIFALPMFISVIYITYFIFKNRALEKINTITQILKMRGFLL
jgi:ABC-type lipoprotein export system ATPase subunit